MTLRLAINLFSNLMELIEADAKFKKELEKFEKTFEKTFERDEILKKYSSFKKKFVSF